MPSGVMAQSIALLIHRRHRGGPRATGLNNVADEEQSPRGTFACHRTSHLLLHEGEAYSELLNLDAIVLPLGSDGPCGGSMGNTLGVEPMRLVDVEELLCSCDGSSIPSTIILELPHREVGGKLTPWEEVEQMGTLCKENGIAFHADGARLFEAAAGYG
jgi:threonine aldolase